ncbi:hypothetical protein [Aquimarina sp. BL5]|uniref:hypothetical protein n=1 Tax=Aquimarina sp. BL5 TaxID=1714860 RepID=UPI0011C382C0|nr:hypothetical protein [Aquimarina sp. BL5]
MRKTFYISLAVSVILISCVANKEIFEAERFADFNSLTVQKAENIETNFGSKDVTPSSGVSIGESLYPNKNKHKLATPKTYQRIVNNKFNLETEYFYTATDSLVRVMMYEWTEPRGQNRFDSSRKTDTKKFRRKYAGLKKQLKSKLGEPSFIEIASDTAKSNFRDGIKWLNGNENKAYLFMLGSNTTNYRKIRLVIYRE